MFRFSRWLSFSLLLLGSAACGPFGDPSGPEHDEADRRPAVPPVATSRLIDADAPLDVRLLRVEPGLHVGSERVCDVIAAGQPQEVTARSASRYVHVTAPGQAQEPTARSAGRLVRSRRAVRCGAATGEGWVDLVFPEPTVPFVGSAVHGTRLRVKVVAAQGGFEDLPIVEFVAVLGNSDADPTRYEDFLSLPAGFDFSTVEPEDVGRERRCVVAYVGLPEALDEPEQARLPGRPTHRVNVVCKHGLGDAWVDLVFAEDEPEAALSLRRGARASCRIVLASGGAAGLPVVSLVEVLPYET